MDQTPRYLRRQPSTEYLRRVWGIEIAPTTLAKMCSRRCGPATVHSGRVALHAVEALDDFARSYLKPHVATAPSTALHPGALAELRAAA